MSSSSTLMKDEEIIKEEVTEEVYKKAAAAKNLISQNNLRTSKNLLEYNIVSDSNHTQNNTLNIHTAETCDLTSVTGYEGTSLNDTSKLTRLRPKNSHPQVSGPNIKNVTPSTYQKSLNKLQWAITNKDSFVESVEFWPKFNQTIFDKKGANFNLQKSKFNGSGFNKGLKPRDALMYCKDHSRLVVKQKEMKATKFNQEVTRQYPREEIKFVTEKSTDWFKLFKNAVSLELTNPKMKRAGGNSVKYNSNTENLAQRTFRREVMIQNG